MEKDKVEEEGYDDDIEREFWNTIKEFLDAHKDHIGEWITAHAKNVEKGPKYKLYTISLIFATLLIIIALLALLTRDRLISGDAFAFLIGAIVGYLFSFLKQSNFGVNI